MKVLVAKFSAECNEHILHTTCIDEFNVLYDEMCIESMHVKDIFDEAGIELIPSISATINPNGMIQRDTFDFIVDKILSAIKVHLKELDGIYLQLHGASGVVGLDCISGEHFLVKKIREITGRFMPISLTMDPHGNLTQELANDLNIVRCYRESPHSDTVDTQRLVAYKLIDLLKNRRAMTPIVKKIPIMVGGERSVSAKEPMRSINALMDKFEEDPRVFSISYHVGFIRHDDDKLGAAVCICPNTTKDIAYCDDLARQVCEYAWNHRHEFKFSGNYDYPSIAVQKALAFDGKTAVITDSGDNCGAGGGGLNTYLLREVLKQGTAKKVLFAGINHDDSNKYLANFKVGDEVEFDLGQNQDYLSEPVHIKGLLIAIGKQMMGSRKDYILGDTYTVRIADTNIDVIVVNHNVQYGYMEQFEAAGLAFHDYDVVVVKMGYLDTYLIPETAYHIMALTDGPTIQESEHIPFKMIYRPMWPIDEMDELEYIEF